MCPAAVERVFDCVNLRFFLLAGCDSDEILAYFPYQQVTNERNPMSATITHNTQSVRTGKAMTSMGMLASFVDGFVKAIKTGEEGRDLDGHAPQCHCQRRENGKLVDGHKCGRHHFWDGGNAKSWIGFRRTPVADFYKAYVFYSEDRGGIANAGKAAARVFKFTTPDDPSEIVKAIRLRKKGDTSATVTMTVDTV